MEKINFPEMEETILKFWEENKIFEKSLEIREKSPRFVFFEGPPYANGKPGIHHILGRVFKDLFCRYKTMRGFFVERKAGWDTHGLPVEIQTEKELGFKTKKEIENYGIEKFNQKCRENVWKYKDEWDAITKRIGFWLDLEHPYITYENDYIESLWWIIKQIYDKGLLVKDYRVAPYCPRCETTLSSHEMAQGYKEIKEDSIFFKLKVKSKKSPKQSFRDATGQVKVRDAYFLVWTTTPWTLSGNVALAINSEIDYVLARNNNEKLILAKERSGVLSEKYEILQEFKGKDLLGWEYEPIYDFIKPANSAGRPAYRVVAGDFVSTKEGTGIVHIAPAFGEDDMKVGKENDLPVLMTVDKEGRFVKEIKLWAGESVKSKDGDDVNSKITEELEGRNLIYKKEKYKHEYPHCWRCENPLIYYALDSWFIKMSQLKEKLIENNQKINWVPEHVKEGRFGDWLKELKDWNFSRERYWGVPLPIWKCEKCEKVKVIGSIKELEDLDGKKIKDLHRPFVDEIFFDCEKCGGKMRRVPEVADIWFDSGAMPFAQGHWPFAQNQKSKIKNQKFTKPPKNYPADFICEGMDQTRGWFYTLLAVSTLLGFEAPYKNVVSYGLVLDKHGKKMSKSKGNAVDVRNIIDKFGVDALRWYFYSSGAMGVPIRFSEEDVGKTLRRFILTLWNSYSFWKLYKPEDFKAESSGEKISEFENILDKWVISEFNLLVKDVKNKLDKYDLVGAARIIDGFLDNFSNWYLRRSRDRLRGENRVEPYKIFSHIFINFTKLLAPFLPFASERVFKDITGKESVHLENFPEAKEELIDVKLSENMGRVRKITALGLKLRALSGIKVRQPLQSIEINTEMAEEFLDLVKDELNIKEIIFKKEIQEKENWKITEEGDFKIALNTEITEEMKNEGLLREIVRHIQVLRKKADLIPQNKIKIYWHSEDKFISDLILKNQKSIAKDIIALDMINSRPEGELLTSQELEIEGKKIFVGIKLD